MHTKQSESIASPRCAFAASAPMSGLLAPPPPLLVLPVRGRRGGVVKGDVAVGMSPLRLPPLLLPLLLSLLLRLRVRARVRVRLRPPLLLVLLLRLRLRVDVLARDRTRGGVVSGRDADLEPEPASSGGNGGSEAVSPCA